MVANKMRFGRRTGGPEAAEQVFDYLLAFFLACFIPACNPRTTIL